MSAVLGHEWAFDARGDHPAARATSIGGAAESAVSGHTRSLVRVSSRDEMRDGERQALVTSRGDRVVRAEDFSTDRSRSEITAWVGER